MEKHKFRNHFSVVFENGIRSMVVIFFIFVGNFVTNAKDVESTGIELLYVGLGLLGVLILLLGWQVLIWAKTFIYIQENTLVVERNTLNRKKNTIGLKNISNINLEQNLFEMLIGTCKVKLDTNTLTTADQTDVKIVLRKRDAELFKQRILGNVSVEEPEQVEKQRAYEAPVNDIIMHGFLSLNLFSVLVLAGAVLGVIGGFSELSFDSAEGGLLGNLLSVLVAGWFVAGLVWKVLKEFVKYLNFRIERKGDKILLNYGMFKKVAYSIPVDKINGVRLVQTGIARLAKCYMVEVINVGLGDDENEAQSFFLPYGKSERIVARMKMLLPEFTDGLELVEEKEPKEIWIIWIPRAVIFVCIMAALFSGFLELAPSMIVPVAIAIGISTVILMAMKVGAYLTKGIILGEQLLRVVDGRFGRRVLLVKYEKIQYIVGKQNPIAKKYGLQKGEIHLLAAARNQIHVLPYFKEERMEMLKRNII